MKIYDKMFSINPTVEFFIQLYWQKLAKKEDIFKFLEDNEFVNDEFDYRSIDWLKIPNKDIVKCEKSKLKFLIDIKMYNRFIYNDGSFKFSERLKMKDLMNRNNKLKRLMNFLYYKRENLKDFYTLRDSRLKIMYNNYLVQIDEIINNNLIMENRFKRLFADARLATTNANLDIKAQNIEENKFTINKKFKTFNRIRTFID
eukprot:GHVR01002582.1.p1 GENE.GHVR01002582.1~~GHVR01002582.1.p1  ORF type:complete len:201 (+),score=30.71 GHVR01002582.1:1212-1814(+)